MQILNIFNVLITIAMISIILIQKGAGATAGAAFGSGASGTVFGARGAGNFLTHSTWVLATLFALISLTMAVMASRISQAPDTDLGVVATTPAIEEVVEYAPSDLPLTVESASPSDVPTLDAVVTQPAVKDSAGDLPAMEIEAGTVDEPTATDDGS